MYLVRSVDWLSVRVGEEQVMMSTVTGDYVGLTETAAAIWDIIEVPRDIDAICAELQRSFDVSDAECRTQVERFVAQLEERGAAVWVADQTVG